MRYRDFLGRKASVLVMGTAYFKAADPARVAKQIEELS